MEEKGEGRGEDKQAQKLVFMAKMNGGETFGPLEKRPRGLFKEENEGVFPGRQTMNPGSGGGKEERGLGEWPVMGGTIHCQKGKRVKEDVTRRNE